MILGIVLAVTGALAAFVVWRYTSVRRGAEARDARLLTRLDPLAEKFEKKQTVSPNEVKALAAAPELREMLYAMLSHYQRTDLFPRQYLSKQAQAEAALVHWMLHPNEFGAAPSTMELVEAVRRDVGGKQGEYFVFRFKMPPDHWEATEWLLGLAGPVFPDDEPYRGPIVGFARAGDVASKIAPRELVDWYVDMRTRKGLA